MNVIAIIVTYNGAKWINKCFGSLVDSSVPVKIISIDNASTDGTPQIIRDTFPQVEVIETGQNLGFGKANNIGLRRALEVNADYVFLLNQDAWVESDTIERLILLQKKYSQYDLLSPIHLNGCGDAIDFKFQNYLSPNFTLEFYSDLYLNKVKEIYESKFVNAAAWLISRNCIEIVGGFDPLFKHYGEDKDYVIRLNSNNLKLAIVPSAIAFHDRRQDGQLGEQYNVNRPFIDALICMKSDNKPSISYLCRKIIANYFLLIFFYAFKDNDIKRIIQTDLAALSLRKKALFHLSEQRRKRPFLEV